MDSRMAAVLDRTTAADVGTERPSNPQRDVPRTIDMRLSVSALEIGRVMFACAADIAREFLSVQVLHVQGAGATDMEGDAPEFEVVGPRGNGSRELQVVQIL